jgi:hypothetical protein
VQEGPLIIAHDNPRIGAAYEVTARFHWKSQSFYCHVELLAGINTLS